MNTELNKNNLKTKRKVYFLSFHVNVFYIKGYFTSYDC